MHCSFERADAVAQAGRAAGFRLGLGAADPVIAHLDYRPVSLNLYPLPGRAGVRMLDDVGEYFEARK